MASEPLSSPLENVSLPGDFALRDSFALALDTDDLVEALELADELSAYFGVMRVGLELFCSTGPDAIAALRERGFEVFVDLKLHDTVSVVHKTARILGAVGTSFLSLHTRGGLEMLSRGVVGLFEGADAAGLDTPMAVAITVLPTDHDAPPHIVPERLTLAVEAGCGGLVCAADDLSLAMEIGPKLFRIVSGIRGPEEILVDQPRSVTPAEALSSGADLVVVGRVVTAASDPRAAAAALLASLTPLTV